MKSLEFRLVGIIRIVPEWNVKSVLLLHCHEDEAIRIVPEWNVKSN